MTRTHYETLGVSETADQDQIKHAYRRLAWICHPDRNRKKGAEEKFKEINSAYQVLGDPGRRQVYDYDLRQSRKAGAASGSSSAGASAPPPPPPPGSSRSTARQASSPPPPPAAQSAYRYLFFFRGALVGGSAVAVVVILAVAAYAGCRRPSAEPAPSTSVPQTIPGFVYVPPAPAATPPAPTPSIPEPTPEPTSTPEPTPVTPEPTPASAEPTPAPSMVHLSGKWRGSFEWRGRMVPFAMQLEQNGSAIFGIWTESRDNGIFRAVIHGEVDGSTLRLVILYDRIHRLVRNTRIDTAVTYVASEPSPEFLRGSWEASDGQGFWQAIWEGPLTENDPQDDSWRRRPHHPER